MKTGHIYTPENDTYQARLSALQEVLRAREQVKRGRLHADSPEWSNALGSLEEIEQAEEVIDASFSMAAQDFNREELQQARSDKALTDNQLTEIINAVRTKDIDARRNDNSSDEKSNSNTRS